LGKLTGANLKRGTPSDYSNFLDRLFGMRLAALVLLCARSFDAALIDRRLGELSRGPHFQIIFDRYHSLHRLTQLFPVAEKSMEPTPWRKSTWLRRPFAAASSHSRSTGERHVCIPA
jgi:hypothetical protein